MPIAQHEPRIPALPTVRSQRRLFFGAAGLLVAGDSIFWVMLAAVQSNSGLAAWDGPVHDGLMAARNPLATAVLTAVTTVTSPLWMCVIGGVLALAWSAWTRELWRPALLLSAMTATFALSTVIKHQVGRARPPASDFLLGPDDALSFPSGHTLGAGVLLLVLAYLLVARRAQHTTAVLAFAGAAAGTVLVALSRLYLGYHWLTDVLASLGLAVAVVGIVILADGLREARRAPGSDGPDRAVLLDMS
jgi:membrane-associated phospholipid phosphatase